jgi:hypothetical protein
MLTALKLPRISITTLQNTKNAAADPAAKTRIAYLLNLDY